MPLCPHELPPEQVERRRRTARELGLGKNLQPGYHGPPRGTCSPPGACPFGKNLRPGYHGPRWTADAMALLGKLPDAEVARRTGRTADAVRQKRELLGVPNLVRGRGH